MTLEKEILLATKMEFQLDRLWSIISIHTDFSGNLAYVHPFLFDMFKLEMMDAMHEFEIEI